MEEPPDPQHPRSRASQLDPQHPRSRASQDRSLTKHPPSPQWTLKISLSGFQKLALKCTSVGEHYNTHSPPTQGAARPRIDPWRSTFSSLQWTFNVSLSGFQKLALKCTRLGEHYNTGNIHTPHTRPNAYSTLSWGLSIKVKNIGGLTMGAGMAEPHSPPPKEQGIPGSIPDVAPFFSIVDFQHFAVKGQAFKGWCSSGPGWGNIAIQGPLTFHQQIMQSTLYNTYNTYNPYKAICDRAYKNQPCEATWLWPYNKAYVAIFSNLLFWIHHPISISSRRNIFCSEYTIPFP